MRILGKKSLSSVVKVFVDVAYYMAILVMIALIVAVVAVYFWNPKHVSQEIPIAFDLDPSTYHISSDSWKLEEAHISQATGKLRLVGLGFRETVLPTGLVFPALAIVLLVLNRLRAIFRTLRQGSPFVFENASRIRMIGLALICFDLIKVITTSWTAHRLLDHLTTAGITIRPGFDSGFVASFAGILLIIIAEVFRQGSVMKRDIETAREIQFELVPDPHFEEGDIRIYSHMRPANTVGGDYYDLIPLAPGRVAVVIGDVSGKGMPAALLMSLLQGSLKTLLSAGFRGVDLIAKLNTSLCRNTPGNRMVTMFYSELDTQTGEMLYVNAGHNAPFLMRAGGGTERLHATGTVLGLLEGMQFESGSLALHDGDSVLLFTDGIPEAFNAREEEFGETRLLAALQRPPVPDPRAFVENLVTEVTRFCYPALPTDDMTLMLLMKKSVG